MALETKKEGNVVSSLAATQPLPKMVKIKQLLDHSHYTVEEIPGIVYKELDRPELRSGSVRGCILLSPAAAAVWQI